MEFIVLALGLSLGANAFLAYLLAKSKKDHAKSLDVAKKAPVPTVTAEQLLHDLTSGSAIVRVERINPGDFFLRSPRT